MTSRPLVASRRNPLAVIEPSGYSSAAATPRRSGVSSPIRSRGGVIGARAMTQLSRNLPIGGDRHPEDSGQRTTAHVAIELP
jgi:hypothetical protein